MTREEAIKQMVRDFGWTESFCGEQYDKFAGGMRGVRVGGPDPVVFCDAWETVE